MVFLSKESKELKDLGDLEKSFTSFKGIDLKEFSAHENKLYYNYNGFVFEFTFPLEIAYDFKVRNFDYVEEIAVLGLDELCSANSFSIYHDHKKICDIKYVEKKDKSFKDLSNQNMIVGHVYIDDNGVLNLPVRQEFMKNEAEGLCLDEDFMKVNLYNDLDKISFVANDLHIDPDSTFEKSIKVRLLNFEEKNSKFYFKDLSIGCTRAEYIFDNRRIGLGDKIVATNNNEQKSYYAKRIYANMSFEDNLKLTIDDILLLGFDDQNTKVTGFIVDKKDKYKLATPVNINNGGNVEDVAYKDKVKAQQAEESRKKSLAWLDEEEKRINERHRQELERLKKQKQKLER